MRSIAGDGRENLASACRSTADIVVQVNDLRVELVGRSIDIVDGVTFDLREGEVLGLVGESGSGKTTIAFALLGYARLGTVIAGGSVVVDGLELLSLPEKELRRYRGKLVSYVPQDPGSFLNPALRIGTQLREVLDAHGYGPSKVDRRRRLAEMLQEVSLPADHAFLRRYPHQLSGGQQQRVALAMAFACHPRLIVLDEPTTGLDVTTQAHVLRTVRELCANHSTAAVYVSHDLAVVAYLAHSVAVMYAGRLMEVGPTDTVVRQSANPYTRGLIQAVPDPKRRRELAGIPGQVPSLGRRPDGCVFASRCGFVEEQCRSGSIELLPLSPGHESRCRRSQHVYSLPADEPSIALGQQPAGDAGVSIDAPLLAARELDAWYSDHLVLQDVGFSIARGDCLALVGESGSGKTTLAWCVGGLHIQASGQLHLAGSVLPFGSRSRPAEMRRAIQYIFQNPYSSLNPRKTVRQLLDQPLQTFAFGNRRARAHRIRDLLEDVSLSPTIAERYPEQLSGGERQRVAIARALAAEPQLLICDEITSSLDVSVQASILELLAQLREQVELTLLFVTHNLALVRAIADQVVVLKGGRIVEAGPVNLVMDEPRHHYTSRLLTDTPTFSTMT